MRVCEIIGNVVLARAHPALAGLRMLVAAPFSLADLETGRPASGEEIVIADELGAGTGSLVAVSEGREAAMPFHPQRKPVDAYCACILDRLHVE